MKKRSLLPLLLAALLTGIALFYAWTDWYGAHQLKAALAMLLSKHESIRLEDIMPPPVSDERNVASTEIIKDFYANPRSSRVNRLKMPVKDHDDFLAEEGETTLHFQARRFIPPITGDEMTVARGVLKALKPTDPIVEELREALSRPCISFQMNYLSLWGKNPPWPLLFQIPQRLQVQALAELTVGSEEKAFANVQTLLDVTRALAQIPLIPCHIYIPLTLEFASEVIVAGIDSNSWNDTQLASFSAALGHINILDQNAEMLRGWRAENLQLNYTYQRLNYTYLKQLADEEKGLKSLFLQGIFSSEKLTTIARHLRPKGWLDEDRAIYSLTLQKLINALEEKSAAPSSHNILSRFSDWPTVSAWDAFKTPFAAQIPWVCRNMFFDDSFSIWRTQTILNSLSATCAVERYRLAHHQLPSSLDELVPTLLPSVPKDPMTGDPLHYKTSADGSFVIYGLGWNRKDEGGPKVSSISRIGFTSFQDKNWGIVVTAPK